MMASGKRIPIDALRRGMYVADVYNDSDILLYSARTLITSENQIETLKKQGVTSLYIFSDEPTDQQAGESHHAEEGDEAEKPSVESLVAFENFQHQIKTAALTRNETISAVHDAMTAVKMGRIFSARSIENSADRLVGEVRKDPDLFFGLARIKSAGMEAYSHAINVAVMTAAFAESLDYQEDRIREVAVGGLLHDIGKMKIPESLWLKNERCTRNEFDVFMQHPLLGVAIVEHSHQRLPDLPKKMIAQHHERINGGGYPGGLRGDRIHEASTLCALADRYDFLTTKTPFHTACMPQEALALIYNAVGVGEYPRELAEQFTRLLGIYPIGSFVKLQSGEKGIVIRIHRTSLLTPVVLVLFNKKGKRLDKPFVRDLQIGAPHNTGHAHYKIEGSLDPAQCHFNLAQYLDVLAS